MKKRLDVLLVERGLVESRATGAGAHPRGACPRVRQARPAGRRRCRARRRAAAEVRLPCGREAGDGPRRVRRAPGGAPCLDIGASTGGFTDCLLQGGAARVIALDVGYGQLHPRLRDDPRVIVMERTNARHLTELPFAPQLVVCDASFISAAKVVEPALRLAASGLGGTDPRQAPVRGWTRRRAQGRRP